MNLSACNIEIFSALNTRTTPLVFRRCPRPARFSAGLCQEFGHVSVRRPFWPKLRNHTLGWTRSTNF